MNNQKNFENAIMHGIQKWDGFVNFDKSEN